jgi:hypothetical protein
MQTPSRLTVPSLIGLDTEAQPASVQAPLVLENMTVDPRTGGWRHAGGYERYVPDDAAIYEPFTTLGRIDSVHVFSQNAGARYCILLESGGSLGLLYEAGGSSSSSYYAPTLKTIRSGRSQPTGTQPASFFSDVGDRCLVTNGYDRPLLLTLWPLGDKNSVTESLLSKTERTLGWSRPPRAPGVYAVQRVSAGATPSYPAAINAGALPLFWPTQSGAFSYPKEAGLGLSQEDSENAYRYRVSFISDTGSESPLSEPSSIVSWSIPTGEDGFKYGVVISLPLGPLGTVARRVYRTGNMGGDSSGSASFYYLADVANNVETIFSDASDALGGAAPGDDESVTLPSPEARFSALFQSCVWLDGGVSLSRRLYYSNPRRPDQFSATSFLELSSAGGGITGIYPHYNVLVVFRERGIDIVTGSYGSFQCRTVSLEVSCRSPHTVDSVPGEGLMFLAEQGVFALQGGLEGGAVVAIEERSAPIREKLQGVSREFLARAVGRFCPVTREYHVYVPVDGDDRPSLGLIYHIDKRGWSTRTGYPVGCLDRLPNGDLVFGHSLGYVAGQGGNDEVGLFVISRSMTHKGSVVLASGQDPGYFVEGASPSCIFSSPWLNFGDTSAKKQVQEVVLSVVASGNAPITLKFYKNQKLTGATDGARTLQPTDEAALSVFGTVVLESTTSNKSGVWEGLQVVPVRFPVPVGACNWFRFEVESAADLTIVGYEVGLAASAIRAPSGRGAP